MARVLIIDHEAHLRLLYRLELELEGYEVLEVGAGNEALTLVAQEKLDAVVMTFGCPIYHGANCWIRCSHTGTSCRSSSTPPYEQWRNDFHSWGAEAYVVKSSGLSDLKHALARFDRRSFNYRHCAPRRLGRNAAARR